MLRSKRAKPNQSAEKNKVATLCVPRCDGPQRTNEARTVVACKGLWSDGGHAKEGGMRSRVAQLTEST